MKIQLIHRMDWMTAIDNEDLPGFKNAVKSKEVADTHVGIDTPATYLARNSWPGAGPFLDHLVSIGANLSILDKDGMFTGTTIGKVAAKAIDQTVYNELVDLNDNPGLYYKKIPGISYVSSFTRGVSGTPGAIGSAVASTPFWFYGGRRTRRLKSKRKTRRKTSRKTRRR